MRAPKFLLLNALALLLTGLTSCDIVEGPKKNYDLLASNAGKKILVEEFTGHRCPNCPSATRELVQLDSIYGEDLIVVGIHSGYFADPVPSLGYNADYRTTFGEDIALEYDAENYGYPCALLNRRMLDASSQSATGLSRFSQWGTFIQQMQAETPDLGLYIYPTYEEASRSLRLDVSMKYYKNGSNAQQLMVLITEDSIVSKQLDGLTDVSAYTHRHVVRTSLTGVWGDQISPTSIGIGDSLVKSYTYTLDPAWDAHHVSVVAYVVSSAGLGSEVLQAEEAHIHP